ncbi:ABC transporter substrate-binding protein [Corynebacterium sp. S7]
MTSRYKRLAVVLPVAFALTMGACSSNSSADTSAASEANGSTASSASESGASAFPRDVAVGEETVHVAEEPQRIAILSSDATNLVQQLVSIDRIIAVPDSGGENPPVETILPGGANADPEQVLALNPDLVILTARHGAEQDASTLLEQANVPTASFDSDSWASIDGMLTALATLGELTGSEVKASELTAEVNTKRDETLAQIDENEHPRVLTLMARGNSKMIMTSTTMLNGLVREAGGVPIVDEQEIVGSASADPEQVVALAPDVILIEDFRGQGREQFADLINSPALAEVPAISEGQVHYMSRTTTGSSAGTQAVEGLREVAEAIGTLK